MRALQKYLRNKLPESWEFLPLRKLTEFNYGVSLPEQNRTNAGSPVYGSNGVVGFHEPPLLKGPGIVVGRKGTVGAVTWSEQDFTPIDTTYYAERNHPDDDLRWIYYLLLHADLPRLAAATGVPGLSRSDAYKLIVPRPTDTDEQRAISTAIRFIDDAVSTISRTIAAAERLQKGLMQQLLTGRLKPDGSPRAENDFWSHPKAGLVPNGWAVLPLKQLATIQRGKFSHRPRNEPRFFGGPYPFIQTADIVSSRGYIRAHSQTLNDEGRNISRAFPAGSIMITIAANIGHTAIASYEIYATDSVIGIVPNKGVNPEFLELCMRLRQPFLQRMATESAQANINYGNLRPLLIAHPENEEDQRAIAKVIFDVESLAAAKHAKIAALQRLKQSLMQNLLTGRIRLPPTKPA